MKDTVLEVVERSNQRGARMLSVVDLLDAGTLNLRQAAWLLWKIENGASWLVGAKPGGAGKTTVMSALLAMLPPKETIRLTNCGTGWENSRGGDCLVAYEISSGAYNAYIWGEDVRRMAHLGTRGCRLVTNLHADTLEEARKQIVEENGATEEEFRSFNIFLPITISGSYSTGYKRVIHNILYVEGAKWQEWDEIEPMTEREMQISAFLEKCRSRGIRLVADVRKNWLEQIIVRSEDEKCPGQN